MTHAIHAAKLITRRAGTEQPKLAIILGSGLGKLADQLQESVRIAFSELEGFPVSGVSGHSGELITGRLLGTPVILLSGRVHYYEQGDAAAMQTPIETLTELGCEVLALSNAAGATRQELPPGTLMNIRDHINWSGFNPLIGSAGDRCFVDLSEAYDPLLSDKLQQIAQHNDIDLRTGVYAWFSGPSFETPAEIQAIRMLGADAVGMSTVPETILARYYEMRITAVSLITNFAAGMSPVRLSHEQTKKQAALSERAFISLYSKFAESFS